LARDNLNRLGPAMSADLIRMYPNPGERVSLPGLYLHSGLRESASADPVVYTNFISSVDGRIALTKADGRHQVPKATANSRDWRLFQELAALADIVITSGHHIRDIAQGKSQAGLPVSLDPAYQDLLAFRREHGLSPQPAIAIVSASLELSPAALPAPTEREVIIITGAQSNGERQRALSAAGYRVILVGDGKRVDGAEIIAALAQLNYQMMYSIGGPQLFHTLLVGGQLHHLFLTSAHRLLGGTAFDTLISGPAFATPPSLELCTLYLDPTGLDGAGQSFAHYAVRS
jgi:riboflavin biosynthesis pyrimidine reductase